MDSCCSLSSRKPYPVVLLCALFFAIPAPAQPSNVVTTEPTPILVVKAKADFGQTVPEQDSAKGFGAQRFSAQYHRS